MLILNYSMHLKKHQAGKNRMRNNRFNRNLILAVFIVTVITAVTFIPCLFNGFVNWDDNAYVVTNPAIRHLSLPGITKLFTSTFVSAYVPVTMVSFAAEYHFSGINPCPYHTTNFVLHIFNCVLVFFLIYAVSGNIAVAFITALFFGVHPLRVESVAWVSERKDVLYGLFFLAAFLTYIRSRESGRRAWYWTAFALFILSLFSKPAAVSFPLVLLCYEYLKKGNPDRTGLTGTVPFFACAAVFAAVNIFSQHTAIRHYNPVWFNILIACRGLLFYIEKTIFPVKLSCIYPSPALNHIPIIFFLSPVLVAVCAGLVVLSRRYTRVVIFGTLFFLAAILPSLQVVPVGNAIAADRYTYLPSIGLFYIAAEGFVILMRKQWRCSGIIKRVVATCLVLTIFMCIFLSWQRCKIWKNSFTLWFDAAEKYPGSQVVYCNLGAAYGDKGRNDQAISNCTRAIELDPNYADAYYNRGVAYSGKGNYDQTISDCTRAIELNLNYADAYGLRGSAYDHKGNYAMAVSDYTRAIELNRQDAKAYNNRGNIYCHMGSYGQAIADFTKIIELDPSAAAYYNRGNAYKNNGNYDKAVSDYTRTVEFDPDYADAYCNRGNIYLNTGNYDEAIFDYTRAIKLNPADAVPYNNRGSAYYKKSDYNQAISDYTRAIELNPNFAVAYNCRAAVYYSKMEYDKARNDVYKAKILGFPVSPAFIENLKKHQAGKNRIAYGAVHRDSSGNK